MKAKYFLLMSLALFLLKLNNMKKVPLLFIVLCMLFSCKKTDPVPDQLVNNGSLESAMMSVWFNYGTGSITAYRTNEDSFSPAYSLKMAKTAIDTVNFWYWGQIYKGKMPYGEDLTLSAKIKGINLVGNGLSLVIRCDGLEYGQQFASTQGVTKIAGTFDWTSFSVVLPKLESGVTSIVIYLVYGNGTSGTAFFDDISLTHK